MPDKTTLGSHLQLGEKYCIRTVTDIFTGRLDKIGAHEIVLSTAAWITEVGRFDHIQVDADAFEGVEPIVHPLIINRVAIVDAITIEELPIVRKVPKKNGKKGKKKDD